LATFRAGTLHRKEFFCTSQSCAFCAKACRIAVLPGGDLQLISNQEVLALAGSVLSFFEPRTLRAGKRVQIKKCGASGFLPIAPLLTSPASRRSGRVFSPIAFCLNIAEFLSGVARTIRAAKRGGELLDEFTFSFTDRNFTELCLSGEFPVSSQRRTHAAFPFLTNRKIAGDLCPT
jgi:hypothetical protein